VSRLEGALRDVASALDRLRHSWALVGGLAVSARGEPRFTRDIDLAVAVADDARAEALVHSLVGSGYRILASLDQEQVGRLATIRLEAPTEGPAGVVVDLLFASSGIEAEVVRDAEVLEVLPGLAAWLRPRPRPAELAGAVRAGALRRVVSAKSRPPRDPPVGSVSACATRSCARIGARRGRLRRQCRQGGLDTPAFRTSLRLQSLIVLLRADDARSPAFRLPVIACSRVGTRTRAPQEEEAPVPS
jgi:hypothetical protein